MNSQFKIKWELQKYTPYAECYFAAKYSTFCKEKDNSKPWNIFQNLISNSTSYNLKHTTQESLWNTFHLTLFSKNNLLTYTHTHTEMQIKWRFTLQLRIVFWALSTYIFPYWMLLAATSGLLSPLSFSLDDPSVNHQPRWPVDSERACHCIISGFIHVHTPTEMPQMLCTSTSILDFYSDRKKMPP